MLIGGKINTNILFSFYPIIPKYYVPNIMLILFIYNKYVINMLIPKSYYVNKRKNKYKYTFFILSNNFKII